MVVVGKSVGTIVLSVLGIILVLMSIALILKPLFPIFTSKEKFPKPQFQNSKEIQAIIDLLYGALFLVIIAEQIAHVRHIQGSISMEDVRQMVLVAVLYLLVLIALDRMHKNESIAWTYELETDLVVGAVSPDVAIRRIENRRLGPRLQDVVDRFFDELDQRFGVLDTMLEECAEKVNAVKQVPEQYPAERAARLKEASEIVANQVTNLSSDCEDFGNYLKKLESRLFGSRGVVLASLKSRHASYDNRARTAKLQLSRLLG